LRKISSRTLCLDTRQQEKGNYCDQQNWRDIENSLAKVFHRFEWRGESVYEKKQRTR
jgi:virulence-associated protein VapD